MRRRLWLIPLLLFALLYAALWGRVQAAEGAQGDECIITEDRVVETDLFVACNLLVIEGTVEGDLIGAAWAAVIRPGARITGDIWLLGGQLVIEGTVEDDVHFAGGDLDVTDSAALEAGPDVIAAALNVEVWEGAHIPGDLIMFGYQSLVRGDVARDVSFNGSSLIVEGQVAGDVFAAVGTGDAAALPFPLPFSVSLQKPGLTVRDNGFIAGDLSYSSEQPGSINGRISGEITFSRIVPRPDITQASETAGSILGGYINAVLTDAVSLMVAGLLVLAVAPHWLHSPAALIPAHLPASLGWGLVLTPVMAAASLLLLLVSVLALLFLLVIPLLGGFVIMGVLLLLVIDVSVLGGAAFLVFFVARLVFSLVIGQALSRHVIRAAEPWAVNLLTLLLGVLVYALVVNLPVPQVAQIVYWLSVFIGLGAVVIRLRQLYRETGTVGPIVGVLTEGTARRTPLQGQGTENLPPGFEWWDE